MDAISSAQSGLMAAARRFDASAARTVSGAGDLASEAVEQVSAKTAFSASVSVLKTADQMIGSLLDLKA